jgi:transcriptional regulator GlxA family with amidase domain
MARVVVLLLEPVVGFDAAIPPELFGSARAADGTPLYEVTMAGLRREAVPSEHGYGFMPAAGPEELAAADTVIVPGTRIREPRLEGRLSEELRDALASVPAGARKVSICTGAFVLAAAGWLDGRPATTHWAYADAFRQLYPRVDLDENRLFVDDGDVLTSAGLAAGIDLCLHLIRRDHGAAVAGDVARRTVVPPHREGGQAQFIARPVAAPREASTEPARQWALERLAEPLTLAEMAARASMSVRTFTRRFRQEAGVSPAVWLARQRVERARQLLEETDLPVERVAERSGLGTAASLRARLQAAVGVSPSAYRATFRGPARDNDHDHAHDADPGPEAGSGPDAERPAG